MCQCINQVEWSGVLFYTTTGSIRNNDLVATVEDILPMDKGSTGFTSFAMDSRVIDYLMDNNAIERNLKMGLIHSHHNMSSYFSGTDIEELVDGAQTNNIYVSLIVNNRGEKVAKVAQSLFLQGVVATKDEEGNDYEMPMSALDSSAKNVAVLSYDCIIHETKPAVSEDFVAKVKAIMQKPSYASTKAKPALSVGNFQDDWDDFSYKPLTTSYQKAKASFDEKGIVDVIKDCLDEYMAETFGHEAINGVDYKEPLSAYISHYNPLFSQMPERSIFIEQAKEYVYEQVPDFCISDESNMTVPRWGLAINYVLRLIPDGFLLGSEFKKMLKTLLTEIQNGAKHKKS